MRGRMEEIGRREQTEDDESACKGSRKIVGRVGGSDNKLSEGYRGFLVHVIYNCNKMYGHVYGTKWKWRREEN